MKVIGGQLLSGPIGTAHFSSKVDRRGEPWTDEEDDHLIQDYQRCGTHKLAKRLGRTRSAVFQRALFLGVTKRKPTK